MKDEGWISIDERYPPYAAEYLVYGHLGGVGRTTLSVLTGRYCSSGHWYLVGTNQRLFSVTHWRNKPEPPEEEETKDAKV